ncbi:MAG TPA: YjgN family protein [Noviherbaspirillum sp.]|nr:YjgN family protein [Noviherbaspirillum sp.]
MAEAVLEAPSTGADRRVETAPAVAAYPEAAAEGEHPFRFTGSGSEYFRIWVVNLLLTILTLGIYSAWAKVRRLQYFHRNTVVAGAIFDYHGEPKAILKGRILALVLLLAYQLSTGFSAVAGAIVILLLAAIFPWLLTRAFRFKLANTSYRGLRFRFRGTVGQAYRMLILFPVLFAVIGLFVWSLAASFSNSPSIGLVLLVVLLPMAAIATAVPLAHYCLKRFQHEHADYGQTPFHFSAQARDFFKIYGKSVGLVIVGGAVAGAFFALTAGLFAWLEASVFGAVFAALYALLGLYVSYLFVRPYMESRMQNLVWNHTELGLHRFESRVKARALLGIHASNLILIVLTLGLYKPFAAVRLARYRVQSMTLVAGADLEDFLADQDADRAGALGQEAGDLFDFDIAL